MGEKEIRDAQGRDPPRSRRGFALRIGLALGAVLGLGVAVLVYKTYDPSPVGHFRSEEGREEYAASYAAAMGQLPEPTRTMDLDTDFGTVRVYEFSSGRTRGLRRSSCCQVGPPVFRCGRRTSRASPRSGPSTHSTRWATRG